MMVMRKLQNVLEEARELVGSSLPEIPGEALAFLLDRADEWYREGEVADDEGDKESVYDAQYVDEKVAYPFQMAAQARKLALELVLNYHIRPTERSSASTRPAAAMIATAIALDERGQRCIVMTLRDGSVWTLLATQTVARAQRTMATIARTYEAKCLPGIPLNLWLSITQNQEVFEWEDAVIGVYVQSDRYAELKDAFGDELPPEALPLKEA
jgi:hypothetical protein